MTEIRVQKTELQQHGPQTVFLRAMPAVPISVFCFLIPVF
jgi:hypothetical protein